MTIPEAIAADIALAAECDSCGSIVRVEALERRYECQTCGTWSEERTCEQCHKFASRAGFTCPDCDAQFTEDPDTPKGEPHWFCPECDLAIGADAAPLVAEHRQGHDPDRYSQIPIWAAEEIQGAVNVIRGLKAQVEELVEARKVDAKGAVWFLVNWRGPDRPLADGIETIRVFLGDDALDLTVELVPGATKGERVPRLRVRNSARGPMNHSIVVRPSSGNEVLIQAVGW